MNKYELQIKKLDAMINNWDVLSNCELSYAKAGIHDINTTFGLCSNASLHDIDWDIQKEAFKSWPKFTGNFCFPIEGSRIAYDQNANKFTNERLSLAKHVRSFLYFKGEPKPNMLDKTIPILSKNIILWLMLVAIFFILGFAAFSTIPNKAF